MTIPVRVFSDYIWPFCFIGEGIVEKLKQEFDLAAEWIGIEIHPETPAGGRPLTNLFPAADIRQMAGHLRTMGAPFGITFAEFSRLPNSRNAHLAAEHARIRGRFPELHRLLFSAYFSQGLDIGDIDVLGLLAKEAGLDDRELTEAVQQGIHADKLKLSQEQASKLGVTGVPAFFIGEKECIVGAQPIEVFRKALRSIGSKAS